MNQDEESGGSSASSTSGVTGAQNTPNTGSADSSFTPAAPAPNPQPNTPTLGSVPSMATTMENAPTPTTTPTIAPRTEIATSVEAGSVTTPPMPVVPMETTPTPPTIAPSTVEPASNLSQPTPTSTGASFESPPGNKMLKIVGLVILAVVVIGGLGALGYYLGTNSTPSTTVTPTQTIEPIETPTPTATPSPTEDFTTFRGQSYTISYPEDWEVVEDVEPKTVGKESYTSIVKGDPIESTVNIFVEKTITYDKFLPKDSYTADDVTEKMMWGDFEVTLVKQEDDYNQYIFVEEGENTYIINSWGTADDQNTINLILSTFKINLTTQS